MSEVEAPALVVEDLQVAGKGIGLGDCVVAVPTSVLLRRVWASLLLIRDSLRPQIERDLPAELKHINKRRKRNQPGFP